MVSKGTCVTTKEYAMRQPEELTREQLIALVCDIRDILYLDLDDANDEFLNPDKIWDPDTIESVARRLAEHDLVPTEPVR
jgi:hypothetical protein